ncbi:hypothetical protein AB0L14_39795, partial [Streptomyces sp. NPDC052727]
MGHVRAALPDVSFAVESDGAFRHEPTYPAWSSGAEAVELIGTAEEFPAPGSGRPALNILAHHPALPLDAFHERALHAASPGAAGSAPAPHESAALGDMPDHLSVLGAVGTSYTMADAVAQVLEAFVDAITRRSPLTACPQAAGASGALSWRLPHLRHAQGHRHRA